jgi:hypothetical protein
MSFVRKFFLPPALMAALFFASVPPTLSSGAASPAGAAKEKESEVGGLMGQLEVAYMEVVKAIMFSSVQDEDDINFDQAGQWAEEIAKISGILPGTGDFKNDPLVRAFFEKLARDAREIQRLAKAERWEGMVPALLRVQATCIKCHIKNRI